MLQPLGLVVLGLLCLFACGGGVSPEALATANARWAEVRKQDAASVPAGWSTPRLIEELSTPAWEDGAYIAPDGKTLYFIYTDIDVFRFPSLTKVGPNRDPEGTCFWGCGSFPRADLFYAERRGAAWGPARIHPLTVEKPLGGFVLARADKAYFMSQLEDSWKEDIAYATRGPDGWSAHQRIQNVSSEVTDRDPWVGPKEDELWFTSERKAAMGGENIFISRRVGDGWSDPVLAPAPLNSDHNEMQPFLHGGAVYFASDREGGVLAIYRAERKGKGFAAPVKLIQGRYGVGEPTLSADGRVMTFVQVFRDGSHWNMDLMETRKLR